MKRFTIDARGHTRPIYFAGSGPLRTGVEPPESNPVRRVLIDAGALALIMGLVAGLLSQYFAAPVLIIGVVVIALRARADDSHTRSVEVVHALLQSGHCPSCAYNISELPPEDDRRVVCPECGGARLL